MLSVKSFTFNPYQENTYLLFDEEKRCLIIDPGCYSSSEQGELAQFIDSKELEPVLLLNTHGHIDHMLGNRFVSEKYGCEFHTHAGVIPELQATQSYGAMFGLSPAPSPDPDHLLEDGDVVALGNEKLKVLFTPGHSPGHISFYHEESRQLFSGDVLFQGSIGRTDLPGGDFPTLMKSIFEKLLPLGDEVKVFPGHGPATLIGQEKKSNPFVLDWMQRGV